MPSPRARASLHSARPAARRAPPPAAAGARAAAAGSAAEWADRLEAACRSRGLPVTVQRRVVLETLAERRDHPSADRLFEEVAVRLPGVSRATVYRALDALVELGLAMRLPSPAGSVRFEARRPRHDHAHCLRCGRVEDVAPAPARGSKGAPPAGPRGFEVQNWSLHLLGLCAACRAIPSRTKVPKARQGAQR